MTNDMTKLLQIDEAVNEFRICQLVRYSEGRALGIHYILEPKAG
jgi:hypothetical protein